MAAQVASHLRGEILRGGLRDELPGYRLLAERLGVNHKTMRAALVLLEEDGFLVPQGSGRNCGFQDQGSRASMSSPMPLPMRK